MTQNDNSTGLIVELKTHPIMFPTSIIFALVGIMQFSGLLGAFGSRLGGLLLTLFALQSVILMRRFNSSHNELREAIAGKLDNAIDKDLKEAISDGMKCALEDQPQSVKIENKIGLFDMPESLSDVFTDAEKILVVAVSATSLCRTYSDELEARCKREDRSTRFLVVDPDCDAMPLVCQRDNTDLSAAIIYQKKRTETLLEELSALQKAAKGSFSIRSSGYPIECEYIFADYGQFKAIFIRHYTFKTEPGGELRIQLKHNQTPNFEHYHQHLKLLWKDGEDFAA